MALKTKGQSSVVLWAILRHWQNVDYTASNVKTIGECLTGLEGSGRGLIEVLSWNILRRTWVNDETPSIRTADVRAEHV
jgi:hypothetical protein